MKGHQKLVQLDGNVSFIEDFDMMDESEKIPLLIQKHVTKQRKSQFMK